MNPASHLMIGLPGPDLASDEIDLLRTWQVGGYVLFSRNIKTAGQVRQLTDQLRGLSYDQPIIAIDQEGGRVTRTKEISSIAPSAAQNREAGLPGGIARHGLLTARQLDLLGINLNLAPVLDIAHFPDEQNALPERCWGADSQEVISNAGVFNRYHRKNRVATCGKHFPGSGLARSDPHFELPLVPASLDELLREDLLPFTALMPELDAIMTGHLLFPEIDPGRPASLSRKIINDLLRDQLGFDGLALTDDLDMGAITKSNSLAEATCQAIQAGNDLALVCHSFEAIPEIIEALGKLDSPLLFDARQRIETFRRKIPAPTEFSEKRWGDTDQRIFELRADTLGKDQALKPLADGSSPVGNY